MCTLALACCSPVQPGGPVRCLGCLAPASGLWPWLSLAPGTSTPSARLPPLSMGSSICPAFLGCPRCSAAPGGLLNYLLPGSLLCMAALALGRGLLGTLTLRNLPLQALNLGQALLGCLLCRGCSRLPSVCCSTCWRLCLGCRWLLPVPSRGEHSSGASLALSNFLALQHGCSAGACWALLLWASCLSRPLT